MSSHITFSPASTEDTLLVTVSEAEMTHHIKYLGRTGGFKNEDGSSRVPTPEEVVKFGWEPVSYLEQFERQ